MPKCTTIKITAVKKTYLGRFQVLLSKVIRINYNWRVGKFEFNLYKTRLFAQSQTNLTCFVDQTNIIRHVTITTYNK